MRVLITGVRPYKFNDDKTGQVVEGTSVYFGLPFEERDTRQGSKGFSPANISIKDQSILSKLTIVPGIYDAKEGYHVYSGTKARLEFLDFKLIKGVEL